MDHCTKSLSVIFPFAVSCLSAFAEGRHASTDNPRQQGTEQHTWKPSWCNWWIWRMILHRNQLRHLRWKKSRSMSSHLSGRNRMPRAQIITPLCTVKNTWHFGELQNHTRLMACWCHSELKLKWLKNDYGNRLQHFWCMWNETTKVDLSWNALLFQRLRSYQNGACFVLRTSENTFAIRSCGTSWSTKPVELT